MLPATSRVRHRDEFAVATSGSRVRSTGVVVHLGRGSGGITPRAGFIVGRNVGNAVVRNRVRRRLRHVASPILPELPADAVIVFRALPGAARMSSPQLAESIASGIDRVLRVPGK